MSKSQIDLSVENFVAVVTMNNPPVNAQGKQFHEDMMQVMDEISDRVDIRVAILTGAGKCFSAGADLKAKAERTGAPGEPSQHNRLARECFHSIVECRKPIIAAINGPALGAGSLSPLHAISWSPRIARPSDFLRLMLACWAAVDMQCDCSVTRKRVK